jgi:hypothetical protein
MGHVIISYGPLGHPDMGLLVHPPWGKGLDRD